MVREMRRIRYLEGKKNSKGKNYLNNQNNILLLIRGLRLRFADSWSAVALTSHNPQQIPLSLPTQVALPGVKGR